MFACLAVMLCLATAGAAQQRRPLFATVVDGAGEPIAGAEVTCVFSPDLVAIGDTDIVTAVADQRGRARCDLIVGRLYVAWAVGPADAAGVCLVTEPAELVAAGRLLELRAFDRVTPRTVQVAGLEPWREIGAVGLRWFPVAGQDVHVDLPWPEGAELLLPPGPSSPGWLAIRDRADQIVTGVLIRHQGTSGIEFVAPTSLVATVVDGDGAPIEGVRIEQTAGSGTLRSVFSHLSGKGQLRLTGVTDAEGVVRCHVPSSSDPERGSILRASKPGYRCEHRMHGPGGRVVFAMVAARSTEVQVIGAPVPVRFAAQGTFVFRTNTSIMSGAHAVPVERIGATVWSVSASDHGFLPRIAMQTEFPTVVVVDRDDGLGDQLSIDLGETVPISIRVLDAQGGPVAAALGVARTDQGFDVSWDGLLATDLAGRAVLRLPKGDFFAYATTGKAHALALVDLQNTEPLTLRLEDIPTMRLRVVDADGLPVAGARVRTTSGSSRSRAGDMLEREWARLATWMWRHYATIARSDAAGMLLAPAFLHSGLTANVTVTAGSRKSAGFVLEGGGELEVVVR